MFIRHYSPFELYICNSLIFCCYHHVFEIERRNSMIFRYRRSYFSVLLALILSFSILLSLPACVPHTGQDNKEPAPSPSAAPRETEEPAEETSAPADTGDMEPDPRPDSESEYREILASMTLEQKIGQLLLVGYFSDEQAETMIRDHKVGGIVLFRRNFDTFEELHQITGRLREYNQKSPLPLWIALDEEGGTVTRLPSGKTPIPDARKVGSFDDVSLTRATGWVIGREMAAAGANLDFAPVVDIVDNPDNEFMLKRSYGSTADMVARHGRAFFQGLRESGVQGCAKHFPGHGGTAVDSHKNMPVIDISLEEWKQKDAVPFMAMIEAGIDMIMVGHLAYPQIDPSALPASMSVVFMQELLREQMGYKGLIITDDIEMLGYPQGDDRKDAVVASFLAGVDIFAVGHTLRVQLDVLEALKEGVETGVISEKRIAKQRLMDIQSYSLEEARQIFGSDEHMEAVRVLIEN
jgi:beta-N-acetylhexosaminidase